MNLVKYIARVATSMWPKLDSASNQAGPVRLPKRSGDVGHDLCAASDISLTPHEFTWVPTGVAIEARPPLWYMVVARSSLNKLGVFTCPGIIDSGYQGELQVGIFNPHNKWVHIKKGTYIAQCIFFHVVQPYVGMVQEFQPSERGTNGFGSTDR